MMKKILFPILTLILGLVLSGSGCCTDALDPDVYDEGVKIGDLTWATRNVGEPGKFAATPEDVGMYYQWNVRTGWPASGPFAGMPTTPSISSKWEAKNNPCPTGWEVPTFAQVEKLYDATKTMGTLEGVNGAYFGTAPDRIFLPVTGYVWYGAVNAETCGYYFSSNPVGDDYAYGFEFSGTFLKGGGYTKIAASPIRCVKKS